MYCFVEKLVDEMIEFNIVEQCQKEEYVYSILCIAESIIWFVTIIFIGIFFHILWQTVGYLAFLYILRRRTGGYHLSRFISCYSCSIALFVMIYYLLHNVAALIQVGIFGVFVVSGIVIEIIGTVNHPNMFMSKTEILHVKWRARIIAAVESSIVIILWIVGNRGMVLYLAMAMITCAALMVLAIGLGQEVKET